MSGTDTLRSAASLMRERAKAATPGPWDPDVIYVVGRVPGGRPSGEVIAEAHTTVGRLDAPHRGNAAHMAGLDPVVALAVADWLDEAAAHEQDVDAGLTVAQDNWRDRALAVARAYLGDLP